MTTKVFDFNAKRKESIEKKKRNFERVFFQEFLGAYSEVAEDGSNTPIKIVDISHTGCSFQMSKSGKGKQAFKTGDNAVLRIYFTKDEFLPLVVNVKHCNEFVDANGQNAVRYGGEFDQSLPGYQAFKPFVDFLYKFAEFSSSDKGESKVYFL
jgi:hypothetical protein